MQLGFETFKPLVNEIPDLGDTVCVAVSGGADSLALSLCLMEWSSKTGRKLIGLSVNHGLRPEAANECQFVKKIFEKKGIEHHTLKWEGFKPMSSIQEAARTARYGLINDFCKDHKVRDVFLGHHIDDQAETVIMRLIRGSGVDGLSGMQLIQKMKDIRLLRPFLTIPKSALIEYLNDYGQNWIEDPSNQNLAFERIKVRKAMKSLSELGLTVERLSLTASNMQRTRGFLLDQLSAWLDREVTLHDEGYVVIRKDAVFEGNAELILRVLRRIGQSIGGNPQVPRLARLSNLFTILKKGMATTFMGCRWIVKENEIIVCREARNNLKPVPFETIWDNRLLIDASKIDRDLGKLSIRALGRDGWEQILRIQPELKEKKLPFPVILSLFSIWQDESLLAVPHINFWTSQAQDMGLGAINVRFNPEVQLFS